MVGAVKVYFHSGFGASSNSQPSNCSKQPTRPPRVWPWLKSPIVGFRSTGPGLDLGFFRRTSRPG